MLTAHFDPRCRRPIDLVPPVRTDATGVSGPTWKQAQGKRWRKVGTGLYVPATAPDVVEQRIIEAAAALPGDGSHGCVTGWAALRWRGAAYFDGRGPAGVDHEPVDLCVAHPDRNLRPRPGVRVHRHYLQPHEIEVVDGVPVAAVQRALLDEIRVRDQLLPAVQAIDMTAAAGLISVWLFAVYLGECNSRNGVPLARRAAAHAVDESRSPRETWLRHVWTVEAGLPEPLVNQPVYDRAGRLIGVPDLLDVESGLVGEYQGAAHKSRDRHRDDVSRGERFREHGMELVEFVEGDSRAVAAQRVVAGRRRARPVPRDERTWTTDRPEWDPAPETLDELLERRGLVEELTRW